jgi:hypothetical protein
VPILTISCPTQSLLPKLIFTSAHPRFLTAIELGFSCCIGDAYSVLRDGIEAAAHAHRIYKEPAAGKVWTTKHQGEDALKETAYKNFVEPTTRELEQIEEHFSELKKKFRALEELTEEVRTEAIDLAGCWERGNLDTKLDLQRSLFGSTLYFEPGAPEPFLNPKNTLLTERRLMQIAEDSTLRHTPEGWVGEGPEPEEEIRQVGVGDGI